MSPQEFFDKTYITSSEMSRRLGVTRNAIILARGRDQLPGAISVEGQLTIWKRDDIEPHVRAWEQRRKQRLGV